MSPFNSPSKSGGSIPDTFSGTLYGAGVLEALQAKAADAKLAKAQQAKAALQAARARAAQEAAKTEQTKAAGPTTPQGKAIAARNATSHGLFARDVVLPHLGEDPNAYESLFLLFCEQLDPRSLLEQHYVEAIAAASWRLRRLHRWQAQIYEDDTLTEDARLDKLDRVLRHETALHRQINSSVRLLGREVPELFGGRARKLALSDLDQTERDCREDAEAEREVALRAAEYLQVTGLPPGFDRTRLDNTHEAAAPAAESGVDAEKCQNELTPAHLTVLEAEAPGEASVEEVSVEGKCQNDLALPSVEAASQDAPAHASQDAPASRGPDDVA